MSISKRCQCRGRVRLLGILLASAALSMAASAPSAMAEFGLRSFDNTFTNKDGTPDTQAGSHPYQMTTSFGFNYVGEPFDESSVADEEIKDFSIDIAPGFSGDPNVTPKCATVDFLTIKPGILAPNCPDDTAVGVMAAELFVPGIFVSAAVFNLENPPGVPATLGFQQFGIPVTVDVGVTDEAPYRVNPVLHDLPQSLPLFGGQMVLWGDPSDPSHDSIRGECIALNFSPFEPAYESDGNCPTANPSKAFLTLPGSCSSPAPVDYKAASWQNPTKWISGSILTHDDAIPPNPQSFTGCERLPFTPEVKARATTDQAETGTGLDLDVDFSQEGLGSYEGLAQSEAEKAVVTLPDGMTINPSVGEGLGNCTPADLKRETVNSAPGVGCPNASKIGTLYLESPLVNEGINGSVFLAQQDDPATTEPGAENPFDSLIALYLVLKNPNLGVNVKVPIKVEPDPNTGQLVATLEDIPQIPFNHFGFHFREGVRAALVTPSACGTYTTEAKFYPYSDPSSPRTMLSDFQITQGKGGGACPPGGVPPFDPSFEAGSINNNAGSFSPFNMRLIREDGEQDMTKFSAILPPGEIGSLKGVDKCPDSAVGTAKSKTGRQELAEPSCPSNSLIGHTLAGAGVGSALTYVKGYTYLGGPYNGSPLSVISVTPAVAGPFDAGTVVVRLALDLNPKTAEVEVNGANSDPIPHIIKGIVLKLRDLRVYVDRPNFTLNPTSCDESSAKSVLFGSYLNVLDPADDKPVDLSTRYQAANCLNLGFKPKLGLKLKGGTKRGGHPGLKAVYSPKPHDANIEGLTVRLPRSAFLDQAHIKTICTRVQFAANNCPKNARYGYIRAWTPLLDEPLQGPVWLRSSNHKLPDLVFDLHGLVDIEVATRIDSARGGIRASLENSPDAPLSRVVLNMQGGKKGLIINSRNLCRNAKRNRANVLATGHNGKQSSTKPVMRPLNCAKKRRHKRHHKRAGRVARSSVAG